MNLSKILEGFESEQLVSTKSLFIRGSESNYILDDDVVSIKKQFPNGFDLYNFNFIFFIDSSKILQYIIIIIIFFYII